MKRLMILIIALSVIGIGSVFAQEESATPEVTWGVDGSYGYNVIESNKAADTDDKGKPVADGRVRGLDAETFTINPWFQMDWERLMVRMDGRYDQFNHDDGDLYSNVKLSSTYSDLFGVFTLYNDFLYRVAEDALDDDESQMEFDSHTLGLGASVDDFSARVNWVYDNDGRFLNTDADNAGVETQDEENDSLDQAVGDIAGLNQFYSFSDLTVSMDNGVVGAMAKWEALEEGDDLDTSGYYLTNAYLKGYDWFGVWDMTVGDQANAKTLRMAGLGPRGFTSQMGIGEFGASDFGFVNADGEDVAEADRKIDVYNVFDVMPGLTLKLGTIMKMDGDDSWGGYLADENIFLGAEYAIEGVATVNAGMGLVVDSELPSKTSVVYATQSSTTASGLANEGDIARTSNFWTDVRATPAEGVTVQLGIDGQFAKYQNLEKDKPVYEGTSLYNVGLEAAYAAAPLTVNANLYTALGTGIDYKKWSGGAKFKDDYDDPAGVYVANNFTEANVYRAALYSDEAFDGDDDSVISPFILDLSVGYAVSETLSVSFGNKFNALEGAVGSAPIDNADDNRVDLPDGDTNTVYAYYGSNNTTLGATITPRENQSLGITVGYKLYTNVPKEGDIYENASDQEEVDYEVWRTNEFRPFNAAISYSFKY